MILLKMFKMSNVNIGNSVYQLSCFFTKNKIKRKFTIFCNVVVPHVSNFKFLCPLTSVITEEIKKKENLEEKLTTKDVSCSLFFFLDHSCTFISNRQTSSFMFPYKRYLCLILYNENKRNEVTLLGCGDLCKIYDEQKYIVGV